MRMVSTDPSEPGIFAVGQVAFGVVALGQVAAGVIAIGQGAVGLVAIGQGAVGLYYGGAMLGIFGRGFPLGLVPRFPPPRTLPPTTDLSQVRVGYGDGWVDAELGTGRSGAPTLLIGGASAEVRLRANLIPAAKYELEKSTSGSPRVIAHVHKVGDYLVCDRLLHVQVSPTRQPDFWKKVGLRTAVLTAVAIPMVRYLFMPLFS